MTIFCTSLSTGDHEKLSRATSHSAILVECGFVQNPPDVLGEAPPTCEALAPGRSHRHSRHFRGSSALVARLMFDLHKLQSLRLKRSAELCSVYKC